MSTRAAPAPTAPHPAVVVPVPPPSPQEVHRKLSMTAPPAAMPMPARTPSKRAVRSISTSNVSNVSSVTYPTTFSSESDSDTSALQSPTVPHHTMPSFSEGGSTLGVIEERRDTHDGSETEDEEEAEASEGELDEGGLRDEHVVRTGYLYKKGERRKTWKKRWFVLRAAKLAYYKSSAEYRLLHLLPTSNISAVQPVELKKYGHAFAIITPSRTFYVRSDTEQEAQEWVRVLRDVVREAKEEEAEELERAGSLAGPTSLALSSPTHSRPGPPSSLNTKHMSPPIGTSSDSDDHRSPYPGPNSPYPAPNSPIVNRQRSGSSAMSPSPSVSVGGGPAPGQSPVQGMPQAQMMARSGSTGARRDPNKPILQGYMTKLGKRKAWRKRWFVLRESGLEYGKSHMDTKAHRSIPISQILHAVEYAPPDQQKHHHLPHLPHSPPQPSSMDREYSYSTGLLGPEDAHVFKVITAERAYILCAPSEEEEIKWLSALRALIERRRSGDGLGRS